MAKIKLVVSATIEEMLSWSFLLSDGYVLLCKGRIHDLCMV